VIKGYEIRTPGAFAAYTASKTFAERAACNFMEKNKAELGFDMVFINLPFVNFPPLERIPYLPCDLANAHFLFMF